MRLTGDVNDSIPESIAKRFGDSDARPRVLYEYDIHVGWTTGKREILTHNLVADLLDRGVTAVQAQWRQQKKLIALSQIDTPLPLDGEILPSGIELKLIDGDEVITIIPALWPHPEGWSEMSPAAHRAAPKPNTKHLRVTVTVQVESMGSFPESPEVGVDKIAPLVRVVDVFDDTADGLTRAIVSAQRMSSLESPARHAKPTLN